MCFPNIYRFVAETIFRKKPKPCVIILEPDEDGELVYYECL